MGWFKIGDLFTLQMGKTPARSNSSFWGNGHIWVSISDLSNCNKYIASSRELITDDAVQESGIRIVPQGTLIMSFKLSLGKTAITASNLYTNEAIMAFIDKKIVPLDINYVYHLFNNWDWSRATNKAVMGLTLNKATLSQIKIPIPSLNTQKAIANILDKFDESITLRKRQLEIFNQLVKSRFLEMFGMSEGIDKHLEDVADICSGITKGRKVLGLELREVPYMAVSNVKMGYIDLSTVKTIMATENEIEQYRLFPNDILMTEGGDPDKVGRGAIIRNPPKDCIHQNHIFRVRLHKDVLLPEFFEEYLQGNSARRYFLKAAKQTTGIASINMKQLRALPVKIPPIKVQIQYSDFVHQVDKSKYREAIFLYLLEDIRICCNI